MKKVISLLMAMLLLCVPLSAAAAEAAPENQVQPMMDYTSAYSVSMYLSDGVAQCYTSVAGYTTLCTRIDITMTLQKKSLLWWSEVESWTMSVNDYSADFYEIGLITKGTYRVKAEITVYSGSNTEELTGYSQTDTL